MHVIRLRYPWQRQAVGDDAWAKVDVPDPQPTSSAELATWDYRRPFNRPTGLAAGSRVTLRITSWQGQLQGAAVNGIDLECGGRSLEADITPHLAMHNVLSIRLADLPGQPACLDGVICLVIDEPDLAD